MTYLLVTDFKTGMDRRRPRGSGTPGSLWNAKNVVITRGGDIENAKKWVSTYALPVGTFGLAQTKGQLFAFGSDDLAESMPVGVQYQRLIAPASAAMVRVLDAKLFDGKFYVITKHNDGTIYHFYNGSRVTAWDSISDDNADYNILAEYMADEINNESAVDAVAFGSKITLTARTAGTAFTISKATVDNGGNPDQDIALTTVEPNVPAQSEVRATATITITGGTSSPGLNKIASVTVNAVSLIAGLVNWTTSHPQTATLLANAINNETVNHGYEAAAVGAVVTITAPAATGDSVNGHALAVMGGGDVTFIASSSMAGGVDAIEAVAQVYTAEFTGTKENTDKFTITIDGTDFVATPRGAAAGTSAYIKKKRVWSTAASLFRFCKLNDPTDWTDADPSDGAGFININSGSEGSERVIAAENYNLQTAITTRNSIKMYSLFADVTLIDDDQPIDNSGTGARHSLISYGNNDLFYLDINGVRSLRPRYGTDSPYVGDVGSPIDVFLTEFMASVPRYKVNRAVSAIEPMSGRLMLAIASRVFVLSYFPSDKVQGWTYLEPGFDISDFVRTRDKLYARSGDTIYLYGGANNQTWPSEEDDIEELVETPFLNAKSPATKKGTRGVDVDVSGTWDMGIHPDPNDEAQAVNVGRVWRNTFGITADLPAPSVDTGLWAFSFQRQGRAGRAVISSFAVHYNPGEAK